MTKKEVFFYAWGSSLVDTEWKRLSKALYESFGEVDVKMIHRRVACPECKGATKRNGTPVVDDSRCEKADDEASLCDGTAAAEQDVFTVQPQLFCCPRFVLQAHWFIV